MGIRFFNSKESFEAKARETKTRKLSIDKNGVVLVSVKNIEWMGVKDAVLVGIEEGHKFEGFENTKFYLMPSTVEDERSFILDYLSKDYYHIHLKRVLDEIGWNIGENDYASYNIIKQEDNLFCLVPKDMKKSFKRKKRK